jgi:hypothetical protein
MSKQWLRIRIRDPVSGAFMTPGSVTRMRDPGRENNPEPGYGINIQDLNLENLVLVLCVKTYNN